MNMKSLVTSKPFMATIATLAVAGGVSTYAIREETRHKNFTMNIFYTGGGVSTLIRTPEDFRILIDGGSTAEIVRSISTAIPFYSRRIDCLVVTHKDAKHVTGLIDILERYDVSRIYVPQDIYITSTDVIYDEFTKSAHTKNISIHIVGEGDVLDFTGSVSARILFPATDKEFKYSKSSPPKIVMNVIYKSSKFIIASNLTKKIQNYLVDKISKNNVLIIGTNDSPSNISNKFIEEVDADYVIYSKSPKSDKNIHGDKWLNIQGNKEITVISDGLSVRVE